MVIRMYGDNHAAGNNENVNARGAVGSEDPFQAVLHPVDLAAACQHLLAYVHDAVK